MRSPIDLFEMIHADVSIALGGREARMPEHLLDRAQVGARVQHMGRERMSQAMRRER